jgi:hypothetical protein
MSSSFSQRVLAFAAYLFFEKPSQKLDHHGHDVALQQSGATLVAQMRTVRDDAHNRAVLRHVIGIEHWAQVRLRELLGAAPFREEYDKYKPPAHHTVAELADIMHHTRQQTCRIVYQLADEHITLDRRVAHNQFGPLSAGGWLAYIKLHAELECKKLHK